MAAILPLKERESAFKKAKLLLRSNVKVLQDKCFNIKGDVLFVQEINLKAQQLMESLVANLSQNLDLVTPLKRGKQSITLLLMKACSEEKKGNTHTPTLSGVMPK